MPNVPLIHRLSTANAASFCFYIRFGTHLFFYSSGISIPLLSSPSRSVMSWGKETNDHLNPTLTPVHKCSTCLRGAYCDVLYRWQCCCTWTTHFKTLLMSSNITKKLCTYIRDESLAMFPPSKKSKCVRLHIKIKYTFFFWFDLETFKFQWLNFCRAINSSQM